MKESGHIRPEQGSRAGRDKEKCRSEREQIAVRNTSSKAKDYQLLDSPRSEYVVAPTSATHSTTPTSAVSIDDQAMWPAELCPNASVLDTATSGNKTI